MNARIGDLAAAEGLAFCDIYSLLEDPGRPGFMKDSPDDVHPGVAGYRKIGETLTAAIDRLISAGPGGMG